MTTENAGLPRPATERAFSRRAFIAAAAGMGVGLVLGGCASGTASSSSMPADNGQPGAAAERAALKWWQDTIAYEVYPMSFLDTEGRGTGTLAGVTEKLDYLASLGVGAIWLTPIFRSPMKDNGYDVSDYYDIDPSFGTMSDMDRLMDEAGKRGIRIVIDLVVNHRSDENAWFVESSSSRDNDKADWYIWRDATEDGKPPTNWRELEADSEQVFASERTCAGQRAVTLANFTEVEVAFGPALVEGSTWRSAPTGRASPGCCARSRRSCTRHTSRVFMPSRVRRSAPAPGTRELTCQLSMFNSHHLPL